MSLAKVRPQAVTVERDGAMMLYYGTTPDALAALDIGAVFGIVYSPSLYCASFGYWRYVRFEVGMHFNSIRQVRERSYVQAACRALSETEVNFVQQWIIRREMVHGTG